MSIPSLSSRDKVTRKHDLFSGKLGRLGSPMKKSEGDPDTSPKMGTPSTGSLSKMTDFRMRMKGGSLTRLTLAVTCASLHPFLFSADKLMTSVP